MFESCFLVLVINLLIAAVTGSRPTSRPLYSRAVHVMLFVQQSPFQEIPLLNCRYLMYCLDACEEDTCTHKTCCYISLFVRHRGP